MGVTFVDDKDDIEARWLSARGPDSQTREPGLEHCAAVLTLCESVFSLRYSSLLTCMFLVADSCM